MQISGTKVTEGSVFFIAEAGINHNGSPELARELIDAAAESGSDAVKFQTFRADRLVTEENNDFPEIQKREITKKTHRDLQRYANEKGLVFLSTPFDPTSADFLAELDLPAFKIGSGDLNNLPLLKHLASIGKPLIVSTGMGTEREIKDAEETIRKTNPDVPVAFLECTSAYPTPMEHANLRRIPRLAEIVSGPVGFSDHTTSINTPGFAVAIGARIVEKHFTIDRSLPGPDQDISLETDELTTAVRQARAAATARGKPEKEPTIDAENRDAFRKSLHALKPLSPGDEITEGDVGLLRPATGLPPKYYDDVLERGRVIADIAPNEALSKENIDV